jgi:mRNA interferase MazF
VTQYEFWWAELPQPAGRRPVFLLSRPGAYEYLSRVLIAEVTRTVRGIPQEVRVGRREGLGLPSVVNMDNLHAVPRSRLTARIGALSPSREAEVKRALGHALAWVELVDVET